MEPHINLMIVGAQKAGTTSLHRYLSEHPDIEGHFTIEFSYFITDEEYEKGIQNAVDTFYRFKNPTPKVLLAKSALFSNNDKAIKRLYEHNPNAKLIFLIREPIARAYSSFTFEKMNGGMQNKDFCEIKEAIHRYENKREEESMYRILVKLGLYADHLEKIYQYFSKEQVKIVLFKDLKSQPQTVCREIFEFAGVSKKFVPNLKKTHNKTKMVRSDFLAKLLLNMRTKNTLIKDIVKNILPYHLFDSLRTKIMDLNTKEGSYRPISEETKVFLKAYFKPYNDRLSELTGEDFSNWNSN